MNISPKFWGKVKLVLIGILVIASWVLMGKAWLVEHDTKLEAQKSIAVLEVQVQVLEQHAEDLTAKGVSLSNTLAK